ncbi:unnamed protein product [Adineta steineri]|uniref:ADP ribosyltransferase domain-containing protein n=1 Tax=Adineta steineri TaxID=433720 RepID=A0A815SNT8_9BILA|nr:unnamed protein product [Adineta steineri]CAF3729583.1 unnamed protein product [Adineta steineri]
MIQFRKTDEHRQRKVKREVINISQDLREQRFGYEVKSTKGKSFCSDERYGSEFIYEWIQRNKHVFENDLPNYSAIVELAAKGIIEEGKLLNEESDAQLMADQLQTMKNKDSKEIGNCCIRLYSMESFLYKSINTAMRNDDISKVDTLGGYCYLLTMKLDSTDEREDLIVYRGCTLSNEMIEDYKKAVGTIINWLSFTSTSKSREQAEKFGNTLFIIHLVNNWIHSYQNDISSLSCYPHEEEILLNATFTLKVDKVEWDINTNKYFIYLTHDQTYL